VETGIDAIAEGNQQVTGSTVININSPKAGIISDENNYLIIGVSAVVGLMHPQCYLYLFNR
jgi:hypothetical protein